MTQPEDTEILARVEAAPARRVIGIGALMLLGAMLIYIAFSQPPTFGWQIFLLVIGGGALWMGERMRRATATALELTQAELRDSAGTTLARVEDMVAVDRGLFAFKPSNGFLLKVSARAPRAWHPGLWWRIGGRIGVGGLAPQRQTRAMAEIIASLIARRRA
ncbi:hypothetical protein R5H30_03450 [Sulfitobacter sp. D35]|uniref:hypothetical protein n=1 Tax=Sulfitobacter sp. D35 TaxID=3083252 RepID=UPI00296ECBA6|nr:hypothetical protein [Sulfitobacter sp. D35]MDW4497024.1 hypothetical protein [Sulfitobacter sp. D35]